MLGTITFMITLSTLAFMTVLTLTGSFNVYLIIIFVLGFNLLQWLFAPGLINALYKVKEVSNNEQPTIHRMVESICRKSGIMKPKVMLANISLPNAFAYGSPRYGNLVAVTTGLLNTLEDEEVEAVLAHEIGHLKHRDVQVMMFASVLPAIFYYIGFTFMLSNWYSGGRRDTGGAVIIGLAAMGLYWILSLLVLSLSRLREYYADRHSIETVSDGSRKLSEALAKIATSETKTMRIGRDVGSSSFKTLFINDPDTAKRDSDIISKYRDTSISDSKLVDDLLSKKVTGFDRFMEIFSTHPNLIKRLRALQKAQ